MRQSEVHYPQLYNEFQISLGCLGPCLEYVSKRMTMFLNELKLGIEYLDHCYASRMNFFRIMLK